MTSYLVWQLMDSAFPSGGFVHSGGLEAAVQHGAVRDAASLRAFARQTLAQTGRSALPLVTAAHEAPSALHELDLLSDVFLSNAVANRASRAQGRALLTSTSRSFSNVRLEAIADQVRRDNLAGHYAPLFGAVLAALGVERSTTEQMFLFTALRAVTSAGVRLGLLGTYEAQQLQGEVAAEIDAVIQSCRRLGPHDIAQTAPLIDLFQSTHDRLYSRLFQS